MFRVSHSNCENIFIEFENGFDLVLTKENAVILKDKLIWILEVIEPDAPANIGTAGHQPTNKG